MFDLPDDLWRKVLDVGINNTTLTYKDLCSISVTCQRLYQLSGEDSLWSHLLSKNFPRPFTFSWSVSLPKMADERFSSSAKSQYRIRLEIRARTLLELGKWFLELEERFLELEERWRGPFEFPRVPVLTGAVLEEENLSPKIQETELAEKKRTRKATVADLFNSTKANSKGFERVPDRPYPREKRSKGLTRQRKNWYR